MLVGGPLDGVMLPYAGPSIKMQRPPRSVSCVLQADALELDPSPIYDEFRLVYSELSNQWVYLFKPLLDYEMKRGRAG